MNVFFLPFSCFCLLSVWTENNSSYSQVPSKQLHRKRNVCKSQTDTVRGESREIKQTLWQRWGDVSTITQARKKQDPPETRTEKIHLQLHARHSGLTLLSVWCRCLGVFLTSVYLCFPWRGRKRSLRGRSWRRTPRVRRPWGCLLRQLVRFCLDPEGQTLPLLKCFVLSFYRWRRLAIWSFLINIKTANTVSLIQILWLISLDFHIWEMSEKSRYGLTIVMLYLQSSHPLKSVHTKTKNEIKNNRQIVLWFSL